MSLIDELGHRERFQSLTPFAQGRVFEPDSAYIHTVSTPTHTILSVDPVLGRTLRIDAANGSDNLILVGSGSTLSGTFRLRGSNNVIFIGAGTRGVGSIDLFQDNSTAYFGAFSTIEMGAKIQTLGGNAVIEIGDDCLIGGVSVISNSDGHPIYSMETGALLNANADIHIGNTVRIGENCRINKGTTIGDGSAVIERSIVSGTFKPNVLIDGIPGRVVAENIVWSRGQGATLYEARLVEKAMLAEWAELRELLNESRND